MKMLIGAVAILVLLMATMPSAFALTAMRRLVNQMKMLIGAVAILVMLTAALSVFALTAYQSGFEHGVSDGKDSCFSPDECHWYILQPGEALNSIHGIL